MALGRLALLWGLHWAGCVLVVAGGKSTWLDLSCHPGPNDIVLLPGQEAIVHCDVGNTEGDTNVTWWKNGETLNTENLTVLPNGGLLLSQGAGSSVEGRYSCMYRNSFGVVKGRMGTIRLAGLPPFYMHPDPQIVHQGSLARFECGISGTPPAQITWQKDQSQLPASKRFAKLPSGVLLISRVQPEDAGLYRCVAANVVKTRYSNEAQLSVEKDLKLFPGELAITRTPQNLTREVGQSAVMECSAEGSGMPVVSWFRQDGNPLSSDIILLGESNLLIKHIQAHHAGVYLCRASYPHSQHFVTATAHLQVLVPPFITQPPEVITRARAGTARFICSATGNPDPIITWLKNGKQLSSNGRVRIQPRGSLVITQIDLEDAGYYQCVAKNILGSACATTRLHVTVQDGQPGPPQDLRALAVTSKTVTVTWERPQSNWERVIGFSLHYTKTGGTENMEYQFAVNNDTTELNVKYLEPGTNYTFYVVAYSPQGASRASEPLVVQTWDDVPAFAPMLSLSSETPEDIHVKWLTLQPELTNGHITKYRIEYITQKDGVVSMVEVKGNETGVTLSSLQPGTVYKVRISASTSTGYGAPSNWVLQRTLDRVNQTQVPPSIMQPPEIITREQAGTAHFICSATGDPDPLITWLKNGKQLFSNERVRIQPTGSLVITQIDLEDAGYYQCVAKNILGSAFATTRLHVIVQEGLPGPPQDLRALAVTSKTVTVTWERPQSNWERVIRFSLHYTKTGGTENMEYQFAVNNDTTELNVKYLEPGTNYSFYVVAYSQQGASRASEPLVVRTRDDVPEAAPMLSVNSETPEDIHVKWLPLQPELTNGHITKYRIEYTTQKDGVVSMVEVKGNETGVMLSSLQPSTVYKVRITASTSAGYGAPSNWVLLRTLDRVNQTQVEQAQVQLKVIAHTDSLFVSWQLPHTDLLITGYRLYYRMMCPALDPAASCPWQGKNDWDHGPIKLKKKRKQYEITDLIPGQLYQVRLVAYYKKQEVQTVVWEGKTRQIPTAPPDFKAQRIPPMPPSHIQVEPNSSTSVWVKWRKPIISSRIVNYTIRCGPWGAKNASQFTYHSSVMEEILISGLKPFTRYEFAVQSNGAGVDGPYSNIVEKMTLPDRPSSPPADLLLQPLSHSSVQVHWRPPLESNGIILQYLILYTANRSHPDEMWTLLTKEGNVFSTEVQDLQSGSKYYFKMGAKTASGWGPYSQVVEVETLPPRLPDVLDMNSVTGIIVGVCLCLLCLLLCMCASFQQGKQRDSGSELGPRTSRGPSSYQRARQGSCSQSRCQDSHELETLMPPRQEDTPSLPIPEVTELIGGLVSNPQSEEKNQLKMKTSWNGSITQNWANHITSYAETIPGELANAANGSANHLTTGGIRMILHDISYESHKVDVGRNHRNPSQNQVEADVIVHSDFSVSERSGHCAGLDSEEEEEEISLDHDKGPIECLTPTSNPHTQPVATESENQDWSNQPLVAISTEHTLNIMATKTPHLANGIPRTGDSQDNQTVTGSPFTTDCGDSCSEDVPLTSRAQQESPLNSPVLPLVLNSEETVH